MSHGLTHRITELLDARIAEGGFPAAFVCTDDGLVVAAAGDGALAELTAAVVSLFDDVLLRAIRDLQFSAVDEVTLVDPHSGRLVVRPLPMESGPIFFLVVQVPKRATWRRHTNMLRRQLIPILVPLAQGQVEP